MSEIDALSESLTCVSEIDALSESLTCVSEIDVYIDPPLSEPLTCVSEIGALSDRPNLWECDRRYCQPPLWPSPLPV